MTFRYSPQKVTRYVLKDEGWEKIAEYDDATVVDNDYDHSLNAPRAMLRAYTDDLADYPDNGEYGRLTAEEAKRWGSPEMEGAIIDCDSDVAVKRTWMIVLSQSNFGHGDMWYVGVVCQDDNGEWTGHFGCEKLRYERWVVEIKGE